VCIVFLVRALRKYEASWPEPAFGTDDLDWPDVIALFLFCISFIIAMEYGTPPNLQR